MKINYDMIYNIFDEKFTNKGFAFSIAMDEENHKRDNIELTPYSLAEMLQNYVDGQIMNFESAFKLYVDLVNRVFEKFTEQIKKLKQENKEMQQAIGKIAISLYNKPEQN